MTQPVRLKYEIWSRVGSPLRSYKTMTSAPGGKVMNVATVGDGPIRSGASTIILALKGLNSAPRPELDTSYFLKLSKMTSLSSFSSDLRNSTFDWTLLSSLDTFFMLLASFLGVTGWDRGNLIADYKLSEWTF